MKLGFLKHTLAGAAMIASTSIAYAQDWTPSGPIKMMIPFQAGGGVDTMGRLLAEELGNRHGWEIIPENVPGKGGATMANKLKDEPADGLSFAIGISEIVAYSMRASRDPGFTRDDFDYISSLTGSQMGIVAKPDRGWKNLGDVIAAAKAGEEISFGLLSQKHADLAYLLGKSNGIEFGTVVVRGGKGGVNGVLADDIDIAWAGGVQAASVRSGDLINLVSGEAEPLIVSPDAPLISEYGLPYVVGSKFLVMAPANLPDDVSNAYMTSIADILNDPESKVSVFLTRAFSGPEVLQGADLRAYIDELYEDAGALLEASSQ
ncbi:MAG: tripartite tricarboxylate transporter substrate-binding protein [Cognatishimia sp.]